MLNTNITSLWSSYEVFAKDKFAYFVENEKCKQFIRVIADAYMDICDDDFCTFLLYAEMEDDRCLPWWSDIDKAYIILCSDLFIKFPRIYDYLVRVANMEEWDKRKGPNIEQQCRWLYNLCIRLGETPWRK